MIRILIADDEKMIRKRLEQCLPWEEIGYEVVGTVSDGEELLNAITELRADVVLTDIKMPGIDGLEVIKRVKELGYTPYVMIYQKGTQPQFLTDLARWSNNLYLHRSTSFEDYIPRKDKKSCKELYKTILTTF